MKSPKKKKIIYKFLGFVLPLVILSIIITGVILSLTSYSYFHKTINQDFRNILKSSAGEIRLYLENAQKGMESLALVISATKPDKWQKEMALAAFLHINTQFMSVSLFSTQGKKIISTGWEEGDSVFRDKETFKKALAGEKFVSGVMLTKENIPFIHMAVPVFRMGEVREILWGTLNLKSVWDVLKGITIGQTGQVYIMDLSGRYIAHREIDRVVRSSPDEKPEMLKSLHKSDATIEWTEDKNGVGFFCLGAYVSGLDWIIVLTQARSEIYEYLYQNILWAVFVTCFICLAALLLGWNGIKHFLVPIQSLHRQVQIIGQGDLDHKVSIASRDEIGDLGLAFNEMTDSLKKYICREVETAKELVQAKNLAVLGTASSRATHEVGNFLNNIGMAILVLRSEALSPKGEKILGMLEKESDRVRDFIHNFLRFSKKPELRLQRMPMDPLIKEILAVYQLDAKERGIRLELDWSPDIPPIDIDPGLIYQVVNNLIKNSLEAMTNPGTISIKGKIDTRHLLLKLKDTGPGMELDILEKIFEPFFTTKGEKGTGLGMSIVKTIVEAHRGTIECFTELNKGTVFVIRLPLNRPFKET